MKNKVCMMVSPCFWQKKFPRGCSAQCPVDRSWCAQRFCDGAVSLRRSRADQLCRTHSARRVRGGADAAATELMLRAALLRRSCDGVAAATELRSPAPSRSFCASRLDAQNEASIHFPPCRYEFQWSWPTVLGQPPGPVYSYPEYHIVIVYISSHAF